MSRYSWITSIAFLIGLCYACIEPFSPPEVNSDGQYLVVDGFLNMTGDTTKIELRRSQKASDKTVTKVEKGAKLWVEGEGGQRYNFQEKGNGLYILIPGKLSLTQKYKLSITTSNGKQYVSDLVKVSQTPPIDSIDYVHDKGRNAVVIRVNTHDATNMTRFYRWRFEETHEYYSAFYSSVMVKDSQVVIRPENIYQCWKTGRSESIILGSTIKLTKDEIRNLPINTVPIATNKMLVKYSILVKQYGLTQDAFEYWTSLAKTTQTTGSLFDAQPSQVTGNIKSVNDPHELVFGYFSAVVEQQKRVFMTPRLGQYETCVSDTLPVKCGAPEDECVFNTQKLLVTYTTPDSIIAAPAGCVDCRAMGGVNKMPSFWR